MKAIKIRFVQALPRTERRPKVRIAKGERGVWQRRFWEHAIRDDQDYARHVDYVHYNPVKHGYVTQVVAWPHSTFRRYVERGIYPPNWAGAPESELEAGERVGVTSIRCGGEFAAMARTRCKTMACAIC